MCASGRRQDIGHLRLHAECSPHRVSLNKNESVNEILCTVQCELLLQCIYIYRAQCIVECDHVQSTLKMDVARPLILIICTNMHGAKSNLQTNMFTVVTVGASVISQDHAVARKAIRQPFNAQV